MVAIHSNGAVEEVDNILSEFHFILAAINKMSVKTATQFSVSTVILILVFAPQQFIITLPLRHYMLMSPSFSMCYINPILYWTILSVHCHIPFSTSYCELLHNPYTIFCTFLHIATTSKMFFMYFYSDILYIYFLYFFTLSICIFLVFLLYLLLLLI